MKNLLFVFIVCTLVMPMSLTAQAVTSVSSVQAVSAVGTMTKLFPSTMIKGMTSDAIKDLQNVLKSDPSVYPEGLVTGYYGNLTEQAIKRLQKKYNISVTGIVDDATQSIIFPPKTELKILVPNGGEIWDKSQTHSILWETKTSPVILRGEEVISENSSGELDTTNTKIVPFYHRASLDLISDVKCPGLAETECNFFAPGRTYHIATVDLYDSQYNWSIPAGIPAGSNYRVRISVGSNVPCLERSDGSIKSCPMLYPQYAVSDASDAPFTIAGSAPPPTDIIQKLKNQAKQMEQTLQNLMRELQALISLINSL